MRGRSDTAASWPLDPSLLGECHGAVADFLFCLQYLEAQASVPQALRIYSALLDSLAELRRARWPSWTQAAVEGSAGCESAAALGWMSRACESTLVSLSGLEGEANSGVGLIEQVPTRILVLCGPVERERKFQDLKSTHGSSFAFHGSAPQKWASILRHGLRNVSHTDMMTHGALHGDGVYLTTNPMLAAIYAGLSGPYSATEAVGHAPAPERLRILALCEVANMPEPSVKKNENMWVVKEDGAVAVRLLLVYPDGHTPFGPRGALPNITELVRYTRKALEEHGAAALHSPLAAPKARAVRARSVTVPAFERRGSRCGQHVVYEIKVECRDGAWGGGGGTQEDGTWRRYSEFLGLRERVGEGPRNAPFPAKLPFRSFVLGLSEAQLETRRRLLELWLQQIVAVAERGFLREALLPELYSFLGDWA